MRHSGVKHTSWRVIFQCLALAFVLLLCRLSLLRKDHGAAISCLAARNAVSSRYESQNFVFLCGYKFWRFCEAVFPDYTCTKTGSEHATSEDILLIGMHASCSNEHNFPGRVLYINGEPNEAVRALDSYYLGPVTKPGPRSMEFLFTSMAALQTREAYAAFIQRPRNTGEGFLLYVSRRCLAHREDAFVLFSKIGSVTSAGKCNGSRSTLQRDQNKFQAIDGTGPWTEAHKLYRKYKFGLVFENTVQKGYVSEKILNAFLGGTVPIYHGTEDVFKVFNRDAFVYFDSHNPEKSIEKVRLLMRDNYEYRRMISQPILAEGAYDRFFALYGKGHLNGEIRALLGLPRHPVEEDD